MYIDYDGTDFADDISTYDLQDLYPGANGFRVRGLGGDDNIYISFVGRNGFDSIDGGEGDDFMSLASSYLSPLPITNRAIEAKTLRLRSKPRNAVKLKIGPGKACANPYLAKN